MKARTLNKFSYIQTSISQANKITKIQMNKEDKSEIENKFNNINLN